MAKLLLVIGRAGQLATELARLPAPAGFTIETVGRDQLDLLKPGSVGEAIAALQPAAVINAAAYTAVDKAETEIDTAFALNRDGPAAIARACATIGASLVHISTDYVFDGTKRSPYVETDLKSPTSVYGRSKSEGEDAVLTSGANASIIRTSWVYASHGANFLRTMLRLADTRDEIGVVSDQLGRPTWAKDLAIASLATAIRAREGDVEAREVFHYGGAGDATWADFAEVIFEGAAKRGARASRVKRITTAEYPTPAKRPANSRLDTGKIERALAISARDWREATALCLDELLG
jgi:dTDP-4-dehydrorhamnose reductase